MLNGSYAFVLQGFQATTANGTPLAIAGSFAANGSGSVTSGELDLNSAVGSQHLTVNGGVYAVNSSGQGCVQLKYTSGASNVFHFALSQLLNASNAATYGRIIEFDGYLPRACREVPPPGLASGVLLRQNPAGVFRFKPRRAICIPDGRIRYGRKTQLWQSAGTFSFNNANGNLSNFAEDFDEGGSHWHLSLAPRASRSSTTTTGTTGTRKRHAFVARPHDSSSCLLHRQRQ